MVGMGSMATRASLAAELQHVRGRFGIGLVDWVMRGQPGLLDDALAAGPTLLSVSFGTDWSWVAAAHDAGIPTITQVYDAAAARRAADAGVDMLVARGAEGGGHGEVRVATLPLLDAVLEAVSDSVPVLAGGGIASARSLAAVLAAGASGAWVGTRLAACPEALTDEASRRALIDAAETDTRITREYDIAAGLPWPERFPSRVLTASLGAEVSGAGVDAGQGVGMIRDDASVREVIDAMCTGAQSLLQRWWT